MDRSFRGEDSQRRSRGRITICFDSNIAPNIAFARGDRAIWRYTNVYAFVIDGISIGLCDSRKKKKREKKEKYARAREKFPCTHTSIRQELKL